eukprot:m.331232 g.331232  ORF g.331232 m.331232 type:complete len:180 (+) comp16679_c0_seq1:94-633(+)
MATQGGGGDTAPVTKRPAPDQKIDSLLPDKSLSKDELKKKRRMLKNRQSASLSRRRKKEYLESLEQKTQALHMENEEFRLQLANLSRADSQIGASTSSFLLERENNVFKEKIRKLEYENQQLKKQLLDSKEKRILDSNEITQASAGGAPHLGSLEFLLQAVDHVDRADGKVPIAAGKVP